MFKYLGLAAAVVLPLWNIPLIVRIRRRKSSADISLPWALGVWFCFLAMLPSGLMSTDVTYRVFSIANMTFFSGVVFQVVRFHRQTDGLN